MKRAIRPTLFATAFFSLLAAAPALADAPGKAKHVVVVVMDGLRADTVTPEDMPTLFALSQNGATFAHHHPVYLSSTEVNSAAIGTGAYPDHTGIMANKEYRPDIDLLKPIGVEEEPSVRKGDALTNSQYLRMPTVAEIVQAAGMRSIVAGTKPVALLLDRAVRESANNSVTLYQGQTLPTALASDLAKSDGPLPDLADATKSANARQDAWTTRILTHRLWANGLPAFTTLWLSEPDYAQHGSGPGSAVAKSALKSSDDNLAAVLQTLKTSGNLDSTDIIVVSDHGFSTISHTVPLAEILTQNGFTASDKWKKGPKTGEVLVVGEGGSVCLYVAGHDQAITARLVEFLQHADFTGVLFAQKPAPGTFDLSLAHIDTAEAPDLVVSLRWSDDKSATGLAGMIYSEGTKRGVGQGNHASLSRSDMHNTLITAGPDFKSHFTDELPTGNADVAPTVLAILGITPKQKQDGRVLSEALSFSAASAPQASTQTLTATRDLSSGQWRQYLQISRVGDQTYLDQGNGELVTASRAKQNP